jgi:cyclopropane fatty-acyl-phospholipid synthase-like methyltransferase
MVHIFNRISKAIRKPTGTYDSTVLSEDDIKNQSYKKFLGGGEQAWEARGAFQLFFLKLMGLEPSHRVLDVGCGPIRAGSHVIRYLNPGLYYGMDYNEHFIRAATNTVREDSSLSAKNPHLEHISHFNFSKLKTDFDYVLSFSVLNHAPLQEQKRFFLELPAVLRETTKVYVTHASWFKEPTHSTNQVQVAKTFFTAGDLADGLDMEAWGWPKDETIFPIVELILKTSTD